jgi:Rab GTPase-binding effector protein 1
VKSDNASLASQLVNLKSEMEGVKTAAAISEVSKQDEIADIQRHCQEEMASLQRIMTGKHLSYM